MENKFINHPAYLFLGAEERTKDAAIKFMTSVLGENSIKLIEGKKHANVIWVNPEKQYILEDLDPVYHALQFKLADNEHFFLVLENIDALSLVCAQSLLKSLEEPPTGYHFILLGKKKLSILPTILSRCLLYLDEEDNSQEGSELLKYFTEKLHENNLAQFLTVSSKANLDENLSSFLDYIYKYWLNRLKAAIAINCESDIITFENKLQHINNARNYMPVAGGVHLFIKNLYITLKFS